MAYQWESVQPSFLREPPGGVAPFIWVTFELEGVQYDLKAELRGVEPVERYGFDMGIRAWVRWGDEFELNVNGANSKPIFDDNYEVTLRIPTASDWKYRVEVPDPEPEPTPTDPDVPTEPEVPSTNDGTPTTGGDEENQASS